LDENDSQPLDEGDSHYLDADEDVDQEADEDDNQETDEDDDQEADEDDDQEADEDNDQEADEDDDQETDEDDDQEADEDNDQEANEDDDQETDEDDDQEADEDDDQEADEDGDQEADEDDHQEADEEEDSSHDSGKDTCINESDLNRKPLYNGTDLTTITSVCLIMQFALSNNLTNDAIENLLELLNLFLPFPNHLPKSYYKLKKFFDQFSVPYSKSEVCTACNNFKEDCNCQPPLQATGHLLHISLTKPLSAVLTNHWNSLQFSSDNSDNLYRDIWDGTFMKTVNESDNHERVISLLISTDGIPLFKSSTISFWPVSFVILNLPPAIRMNSENIVLAGFWIGGKPPMELLFKPILKN